MFQRANLSFASQLLCVTFEAKLGTKVIQGHAASLETPLRSCLINSLALVPKKMGQDNNLDPSVFTDSYVSCVMDTSMIDFRFSSFYSLNNTTSCSSAFTAVCPPKTIQANS